jgi:hypothetical protein
MSDNVPMFFIMTEPPNVVFINPPPPWSYHIIQVYSNEWLIEYRRKPIDQSPVHDWFSEGF